TDGKRTRCVKTLGAKREQGIRYGMRVAIVGSRPPDPDSPTHYFGEFKLIEKAVHKLVDSLPLTTIVISGGARGVDQIAASRARKRCLLVCEYLPDWTTYGKFAGLMRNTTIIRNSDMVHAFVSTWCRGTYDSISKAAKESKPCHKHDVRLDDE
ncbi:MAG TPA: SLOG family protein, partial [Nitrospirota bacterium]